jgi:cation transport ATPase
MLSFIHSRRVAHDLMVLAVLAMEVFFAWRASLMYQFILTGRVGMVELDIIRWLVFLAVGVFGFALATHRHAGVEAIRKRKADHNRLALSGIFGAVLVVVAHDLAATIYTVGAVDSLGAGVAVAGMCCLVFLPFLVGYMSHAIAEGIEGENKERASRKIAHWRQQAELRYWRAYYKQWQPALPPSQELTLAPVVISQELNKNHPPETEEAPNGRPF